ncbi:MAG: hypothetical protein IKG55_06160 [Solobacterium sp.]|nr:hypothetical protein [Solobacterium sp.]
MNYFKTIKNNLMMNEAGKGLIAGGLTGLLLNLVMMMLRLPGGIFSSVVASLIPALIGAFLFSVFSLRKTTAMNRRVLSLEKVSGRMQDDVIRYVSKNVAMGDVWLAVRQGTKYKFWTKDILSSLQLQSQNPAAKQAVMVLTYKNGKEEKTIVSKSDALSAKIAEWMDVPENVNDLTLGQM